MPAVAAELGGYLLQPIDLATNKILALAGRDEPRDFVDALFILETVLPLGQLVWAAVAKDPGYNPRSLLEQLRRRGKVRPEAIERLHLSRPFDVQAGKRRWLVALDEAEEFIARRPPGEAGCLYWAPARGRFEVPSPDTPLEDQGLVPHCGRMGGVIPRPTGQPFEGAEGPEPSTL